MENGIIESNHMEKQENSIAATVGFVLILVVLITTVVIIISTRNTANLTPTPTPQPTAGPPRAETPVPTIIPITSTITPSTSPSPSVTVKPTNSPTPTVKVTPSISPTLTPTPSNVKEVTMNAFEYTFEPATLGQVKAGTQVQLTITNTGNADHDFVIDELGVNSGIITPNDSKVVTFTIPVNQANSYTYYCSIGNHRSMGMQGTIEVVQ